MSETNYFRLIESYFEGSISPTDKSMLEARIKSDPLVKAEFNLQQNIINGISQVRKQELKTRLASISLPTHTGILTGSGAKWLAGTVAGVTIFGSILYWSLISFNESIKPIDLQFNQEISFNKESLAVLPKPITLADHGANKQVAKTTTIAEPATIAKREILEKEEIAGKTATVEPQSLMSYEDDKVFANRTEDNLENIASRDVAHNRADKTEIVFLDAIEDLGSYHYRYYNSKLYLYGNFKEIPYQIIEINDRGKKQLFLSHNEEVFIIKDNTIDITELKKLEDEILRMEIQLIVEE